MTDTNPAAARARGQALRTARTARARKIRRRVISGAVALFVAGWLMITLVLVSGHDPALAKKTSTATTVASTPTATTSSSGSTGSTSSSTQTSNSSSSSSSNSSGSGVSSVTTSQS